MSDLEKMADQIDTDLNRAWTKIRAANKNRTIATSDALKTAEDHVWKASQIVRSLMSKPDREATQWY